MHRALPMLALLPSVVTVVVLLIGIVEERATAADRRRARTPSTRPAGRARRDAGTRAAARVA
jgi:hypothetical protein